MVAYLSVCFSGSLTLVFLALPRKPRTHTPALEARIQHKASATMQSRPSPRSTASESCVDKTTPRSSPRVPSTASYQPQWMPRRYNSIRVVSLQAPTAPEGRLTTQWRLLATVRRTVSHIGRSETVTAQRLARVGTFASRARRPIKTVAWAFASSLQLALTTPSRARTGAKHGGRDVTAPRTSERTTSRPSAALPAPFGHRAAAQGRRKRCEVLIKPHTQSTLQRGA